MGLARPQAPTINKMKKGSEIMRTFALLTLLIGLGGFSLGCTKSIESERKDVSEAQREAVKDVQEEKHDVHEAAREGQKDVAEEQRDVSEAQREGAKNIAEEQRELQDTKQKKANEAVPSTTTPTP